MLTWTIDGWCGYPTNCTIDGWPYKGNTFTIDGWVADSAAPDISDVGGPLLRDPKKRKHHALEAPDIRAQVERAKVKAAEELATTAIAQALKAAELARIAHEEAEERKRQAVIEKARAERAKQAIAAAIQKRERQEKAKQEAIAKAERIATQVRLAAEEEGRRVAAEEAQKKADEQTLDEYVATLMQDMKAEDDRIIEGLEKIIPMLTAELDELDKPEPQPKEKGVTDLQLQAMEALEAILKVTRKLH